MGLRFFSTTDQNLASFDLERKCGEERRFEPFDGKLPIYLPLLPAHYHLKVFVFVFVFFFFLFLIFLYL